MAFNPTAVPFDLDAASDLTDLSIQEIWIKSPILFIAIIQQVVKNISIAYAL